jgi:hypothetical protein
LLHAQRHALYHMLDIGNLEIEAGLRGAHVAPEPLDDGAGLLLHSEKAGEHAHEQDEPQDAPEDKGERIHDSAPSDARMGAYICS